MKRLRFDSPSLTRSLPRPAVVVGGGFTLIELLVVIAIISVLTAMIISVSSAIRQNQAEKIARQDVKLLHSQIAGYFETYGRYPEEWTDRHYAANGWADAPDPAEAAKRNCAWLLVQLERDQKIRTVLHESFSADRYKRDEVAEDLDHDGTDEPHFTYIMDGFGKERAFNYLKAAGAGGTPIVYSAGPDGDYDGTDDIRSDDLLDE